MVMVVAVTSTAAWVQAQVPHIVPSWSAMLWRYSGDTIWNERDTVVRRAVFRGDTVTRAQFLDGRLQSSVTYVLRGDSAYPITPADSLHPLRATLPGLPVSFLTRDRETLATEMQSNALRERMASMRSTPDPDEPPLSPSMPVTYVVSPQVTIVQHGDTARYIRRGSPRSDTTIFVFRGDTLIDRVSPAPRAFGYRVAPIPRESVRTDVAVNTGEPPSMRKAYRASRPASSNQRGMERSCTCSRMAVVFPNCLRAASRGAPSGSPLG